MPHTKVSTELDLSPHVQQYWKSLGYCVHGEVAVCRKSVFIDHVAHTGPCHAPEYVVAIEMKKGASKSLQSQLNTLDRIHVADEIWGMTISCPQQKTLDRWSKWSEKLWIAPGLLSWDGEGFQVHNWSAVGLRNYHKRYYKKRTKELLLVPENRDVDGGRVSGDHKYVTHWSAGLAFIEEWAFDLGCEFTTQDCFEALPPLMIAYRKRRSAMNRMLRFLQENGKLIRLGKKGSHIQYKASCPTFISP